MKLVVLLSGGIDSTVLLADRINRGDECICVTVQYGQRHQREIDAANRIAHHYKVTHRVVDVGTLLLGGNALTGDMALPGQPATDIDATYVPGRNIVLLAIGAAKAEMLCASAVMFGANLGDQAGYPDCRPQFITAMDNAVSLGTTRGVSVCAPYSSLTKREIVTRGYTLGVPFYMTWSCYEGLAAGACGRCGACIAREQAMA